MLDLRVTALKSTPFAQIDGRLDDLSDSTGRSAQLI
jgi:hypothetical protein